MIEFQNRQISLPDGSQVMVCRILGSIDGSTLWPFEEKLSGFLKEGFKYLILVFSQVRYINSTGMGLLVKMADKFQEAGGEVTLVDVPEKLVALFNMLGLLALIKISPSEEEALKLFQVQKTAKSSSSAPSTDIAATTSSSRATKKNVLSSPPPSPDIATKIRQKVQRSSPSYPSTSKTSSISKTSKIYVIKCRQCMGKISLGKYLRKGTYKCPRCMATFKVTEAGKIKFF